MIKYQPRVLPGHSDSDSGELFVFLSLSLIFGPRTVKFLFLIASCVQNTDVGGIYQVIAIKTKNMQQGQTLYKTPRAYKKAIGLIYFLDLKFFTLRML